MFTNKKCFSLVFFVKIFTMDVITIDSESEDEATVILESSDSEAEFGQDENLVESKNCDLVGRNFEQLSPKVLVQLMQKQILEVKDVIGVSVDSLIEGMRADNFFNSFQSQRSEIC